MKIILETHRLRLRPFEAADARAMFENWASDPEVTRFLTWPTHQSVETTKRVLGEWLPLYEKPEYLNFGIELKETGQLVGNIAVVGYLEDKTLPVIGYNISRALWNQGYMTEACRRLLEYLFERGFKKVRIDADVRNTGSRRVIEKCGGVWFDTAEDERPLKGDTVTVNCFYVYGPASDLRYEILHREEGVPEGDAYLSELLELSRLWAEEETCPSYSANEADEYEGKIIALCREQEKIVAYAMGHVRELREKTSYNEPGEKCFELDEVYVLPAFRSRGVGKVLVEKLEEAVQKRADLMAVTAVSYRYKDLLRFYIDELGLDFKYALLVKRMD